MKDLQDTPQNRAVARELARRNADEDMPPARIYGDDDGDIRIILECDRIFSGEFLLVDEYEIEHEDANEVWEEIERRWQEIMDALEDAQDEEDDGGREDYEYELWAEENL